MHYSTHTLLSLLYYALLHTYTTLLYMLCITPHTTHLLNICICTPFASPPPQLPLCSKLYHLHLHLHHHHHDPNSNNLPKLDSVLAFAFASLMLASTCRFMLLVCRVDWYYHVVVVVVLLCCCWLIVVYCTPIPIPNPPPPPPIITIQLQHGSGLWEVGWGVIWITPLQSNFDFYHWKTWFKFGRHSRSGSMLQVGWYCFGIIWMIALLNPLDVGFLCQFLRTCLEIEGAFCWHEAEAIRNSTWA